MTRYMFRLAYDGGPFRGFAINEGVSTVGGALRAALEQVLQHEVPIVCAGRTDAGVHALDQVVSFESDKPVDCEALRISLNAMCRPYIVVSELRTVESDFDARFSCTGRSYRYRILNRRLPDPFRKDHTWQVAQPLDVELMQQAGQHLLGTHDFSSFCRRQVDTRDGSEKPRTRHLRAVDFSVQPDDEIHLVISASSFCQQMVRSITGLCVDIGLPTPGAGAVDDPDVRGGAKGVLTVADVPGILAARDRRRVPNVAPPHGLYLFDVTY